MKPTLLRLTAGPLVRGLVLAITALGLGLSPVLNAGQWGPFSYERLGDAITITGYKGTERAVMIPETIEGLPVTTLITSEWWGGELVTQVYLPASLTSLRGTFPFPSSQSLQWIEVARDNPLFSSRDGILFNKDLTRLIRCPIAWPREQFIIPDTVTHIEAGAFGGCLTLIRIGVPSSVIELGDGAFDSRRTSCGFGYGRNCFTVGNRIDLYFVGAAPKANLPFGDRSGLQSARDSSQPPRIFHRAGAAGWGGSYGGISTEPWDGAPVILNPLQPVFAYGGSVARLSVEAFGVEPLRYQWRHADLDAPGATHPVLTFGPLRTDDAGLWRVVVSNSFGAVTSPVASVTVRLPATGSYEAAAVAQEPLAYWPLDEIIDRTLPEYVGGSHGRFAEDTGEVQVDPDAAPRLTTGDFTVAAWIRPAYSDGDLLWRHAEYIPWEHGNAIWNRGWILIMQGLGLRLFASTIQSGDMGDLQSPPGVLTLNEWQHVAVSCRRDPGVGLEAGLNTTGNRWTRIYRNGVLVASGDIGEGDLDNPEHPLTIGVSNDEGSPSGIRDVALFGRALSEGQIASLYAAGIGALPPLRVRRSAAGLTLIWSSGLLQSATTLGDGKSGPNWADLPGATSPYTIETTSGASFYRVRTP